MPFIYDTLPNSNGQIVVENDGVNQTASILADRFTPSNYGLINRFDARIRYQSVLAGAPPQDITPEFTYVFTLFNEGPGGLPQSTLWTSDTITYTFPSDPTSTDELTFITFPDVDLIVRPDTNYFFGISIFNSTAGQYTIGTQEYKIGALGPALSSGPTIGSAGTQLYTKPNMISDWVASSNGGNSFDLRVRGYQPGDANKDGFVNADDLGALARHWQGTSGLWEDGDFNGNGLVELRDLQLLAENYNGPFSLAAVLASLTTPSCPEPSMSLIILGGALLARRRR